MFRQSLLPRACLSVALGLVLFAAPASGQDRSAQERLDRLERDLNMLQRQVYRGAPAPMVAPGAAHGIGAESGAAVNTQIRMDRIETQIRNLTGRFEEVMNQFEQVRQRTEQLHSDVDMRFSQGPAGQGPAGPGAVAANTPPGRPGSPGPGRPARPLSPPPAALDDDATLPYPAAPGGHPGGYPGGYPGAPYAGLTYPGGPTAIFGTLTPPGSAPPGSAPPPSDPAGAAPTAPSATGTLPSGSATDQYNHAFGLLKQANYPAAETALKAFVESHPKDQMAGNAQYWLGETYYTRSRYLEAATAFAEGYKRYPKSPKAPDGLLKLGMSLARANQKQNACVALVQLDRDFPQAGASVKERAAAEKKRVGC